MNDLKKVHPKFYIIFILTLSLFCFFSCKKEEEKKTERLEQSMSLYTKSATLLIGEELIVKPKFAPGIIPKRVYQWSSDNPEVVEIVTNEDFSATVTAITDGNAKLTIASTDGALKAVCQIQVMDGTINLFVNFGTGTNGTFTDGWNLLSDFLEGSTIPSLKNKKGYDTNISLTVTERFNQRGSNGEKVTDTDLDMPENVASTMFLGNSGTAYSGIITGQSSLKIAGLDKNRTYDFCFFGSRADYTDNRVATYTVTGTNEGANSLNASGNTSNTACVSDIQPTEDGEITVTITSGENNSTSQKFYYPNAMRILSLN